MATPDIADPLVIIGCFRSGTSRVAMALSALGAYFGETKDLISPDPSNAEGYWEHKPLLRINRAILAAMNVPQFDIDFMPEDWLEAPPSKFLLEQYMAVIQSHFRGRGLWGWKDPESTLVLPLIKEALSRLSLRGHYVLCARNPVEVAESEFRRIGHDRMLSVGSWMQHILFGLVQTIGESRSVVVFDDYVANQRSILEDIVGMVEGWNPSGEQWNAALATQKDHLVHVRIDRGELLKLPALIEETYEIVLQASRNTNGLRAGKFDERIVEIDREYRTWLSILRLQDPPSGSLRLQWNEAGQDKVITQNFDAKRSWFTVSHKFNAPPGSVLKIGLYQTAGTVWIRRAEFVHGDARTKAQLSPGQHGHLIDDHGIPWLWPRFGPDQIRTNCPSQPGPYRLELELVVSTGVVTFNKMWQGLSEHIDQLSQRTGRV